MQNRDILKSLEALEGLQSSHEFSIIKLSEPISNSFTDPRQHASDASNASLDGPTPASLEADLAHYSELFAKLRFSYVEQVTKERFIRAIVGDPPLIVTTQENLELERDNAAAKSQLRALKLEVADMVTELEAKGRELSRRYETVQLETARLRDLPDKSTALEERIAELMEAQDAPEGSDPSLNMTLTKTQDLVARRQREQQELDRELESLRTKAQRKEKEGDRFRAELQPLEAKRTTSTAAAREARKRKEAALGGVADDLEQRARWCRASEGVLKQVLNIES